MIRAEMDFPMRCERLGDGLHKGEGDEPADMMASFRPGIRKVDVKGADGFSGEGGNGVQGFAMDQPDIGEVTGGGSPVNFPETEQGQVDTQEIEMRAMRRPADQKAAPAAAHIDFQRLWGLIK